MSTCFSAAWKGIPSSRSRSSTTRRCASGLCSCTSAATTSGQAEARPETAPTAPALHAGANEWLGADEHVHAVDQIRLDRVERRVAHLHPDDIPLFASELLDHVHGDLVSTAAGELVDVERQGVARVGGGPEVVEELAGPEREVRRRDHRDGVGADLEGMGGEGDGVARGLRPGVDGDLEPLGPNGEERLRDVAAFLHREEDPFTRRAAREDAVDAAGHEELDQRGEGIGIEGARSILQGRDGSGDRSVQPAGHRASLEAVHRRASRLRIASQMLRPGCSAMRRMNHGNQCVP